MTKSLNIGLTFHRTIKYLRLFYFRRDLAIFLFSIFVAAYTVFYIGSFLLIFAGIRALVSQEQTIAISVPYFPDLQPDTALYLGVAALATSIAFYLATLVAAIRAGANFGTDLLYKFAPIWDDLNLQSRKNIVRVASFASRISRPVLNALVPVATFVAGIAYLIFVNPWIALGSLALGSVALFAFVPANVIDAKFSHSEFSPDIDGAALKDARPQVTSFMGRAFRVYRARRIIAGVNLLILFALILAVLVIVGPDHLVEILDQQAVLLVVVARTSIMSLNRLTLCLRIINENIPAVDQMFDALLKGTVPTRVEASVAGDEDDEEMV